MLCACMSLTKQTWSVYQTVRLYCLSRDCPKSYTCHQKFRLQKYPKDILWNEYHLYGIILIHLTCRLLVIWYWMFFKLPKFKFHLTASLTDHSCKPRAQTKSAQPRFYTTTTNSPVGCAFWGSDEWGASEPHCSLLSSIRLFFLFMQRNHIDLLIFPISTFLEQCIKHRNTKKALALL